MVPDCLCSSNNRSHLYPWCAAGLRTPLEEPRFTVGAPLHGSSAAIGVYGHPFFGVVAGYVTTWRQDKAARGYSRQWTARTRLSAQNLQAQGNADGSGGYPVPRRYRAFQSTLRLAGGGNLDTDVEHFGAHAGKKGAGAHRCGAVAPGPGKREAHLQLSKGRNESAPCTSAL